MFSFTVGKTPKYYVGTESYNSHIAYEFTVLPDSVSAELTILDPVSDTPVSEKDPNYYLTLGRLTPKTETAIKVKTNINILINGTNYTKCYQSFGATYPINGSTIGELVLIEVYPFNFNNLTIKEGNKVFITLNGKSMTFRVINTPKLSTSDNYNTLTITLGDELELYANTLRIKPKYCGVIPQYTGDLARIYCQLLGLSYDAFPVGHKVEDLSDSYNMALSNESPHDFLSGIFAPLDKDVRTSVNGDIIVRDRPYYDELSALSINHLQVFNYENTLGDFENISRIRLSNNFTVTEPLNLKTKQTKTITGDPANKKPFFQGGYTETVDYITTLGKTVIHKQTKTFGYVPTDSQPWNDAQVNPGECNNGFTDTTFTEVASKTTSYKYVTYFSKFIINKEEYWDRGLELVNNEGSYTLVDRLKEYYVKDYYNKAQADLTVCEKDYIHLTLRIRKDIYKTLDTTLIHFAYEDESYSLQSSTFNAESYTGVGDVWLRTYISGEYDSEAQKIISQPTEETNDDPPLALIITPETTNIINYSTCAIINDSRISPTTIDAPFCYSQEHLRTFGKRYILEQYGLANSFNLLVSFNTPVTIGSSIKYTDSRGVIHRGVVHHLEIEANDISKLSLTVFRYYEGTLIWAD